MTYRAKAALPYLDHERAVRGLRRHLRTLAVQETATPDWSTLRISAPVEVIGAGGVVWYEWTATVDAPAAPGPPPTVDATQLARTEARS